MSKYTTELRFLVAAPGFTIALAEYPIFDEAYRAGLNSRILDHFWFREIGQETADRFNHYLRTRMNEIMPKYNKLYLTESLIVNPFYTTQLDESTSRDTSGSTNGVANSIANQGLQRTRQQNSATPQGYSTAADVDAGGYLDGVSVAETSSPTPSTGQQETTGTAASLETFTRSVMGFEGRDQADLLEKYRSTLLNIDGMLMKDLDDLFMQVY